MLADIPLPSLHRHRSPGPNEIHASVRLMSLPETVYALAVLQASLPLLDGPGPRHLGIDMPAWLEL